MKPNVVSVIIPVYNGEQFIAQALESVFAQDYRPFEVIVVDDGSTDQTPALVQQRKDVRYIRQENSGESLARNNGIKAAQGEFIAFLDADDLWMPEKLSRQMQLLHEHPEYGAAICHVTFFLGEGNVIPEGFRPELLKSESVGRVPSALLARRTAFDKVGLFDPSLSTSQDVDWFARANDQGLKIGIVSKVLLRKRIHDTNASNSGPTKNLLTALHRSIRRKHSSSQ
jgi:glycosyltransferase involved in cell wall biosynthesis